MKTIGMLGGMSWESTAEYYRIINERVRERLGGLNSASILLHSCNFAQIERLQQRDDWNQAAKLMIDAAIAVERGGADFLIICTNTMHICAEAVCDAVSIPLLHIADATAQRITAAGLRINNSVFISIGSPTAAIGTLAVASIQSPRQAPISPFISSRLIFAQ